MNSERNPVMDWPNLIIAFLKVHVGALGLIITSIWLLAVMGLLCLCQRAQGHMVQPFLILIVILILGPNTRKKTVFCSIQMWIILSFTHTIFVILTFLEFFLVKLFLHQTVKILTSLKLLQASTSTDVFTSFYTLYLTLKCVNANWDGVGSYGFNP